MIDGQGNLTECVASSNYRTVANVITKKKRRRLLNICIKKRAAKGKSRAHQLNHFN